jgi:hypothetical protein
VALGTLEAVGPFSFGPVRVGAWIVPTGIPFDISAFLPVPPQNFGTDVQFQLPPVHTVFLAATRRQNFLIPRAATAPSLDLTSPTRTSPWTAPPRPGAPSATSGHVCIHCARPQAV